MNEVQQVTEIAKGISDYGLMAVTAAFFLLLSAMMMIAIFRWFKSMINRMLEQQEYLRQLLDILQDNNAAIKNLAERLEPETQMRIRNLTGFAFDLTVEQVCRLIKRVRKETTSSTMRQRQRRYESLSKSFMKTETAALTRSRITGSHCLTSAPLNGLKTWQRSFESEIYNADGENNARAYTNVKLAYDNIKTEFYQRLNG